MATSASQSNGVSLKEYLKKYESNAEDGKKKKKKKPKQKTDTMGVLVVDEDPAWQKPVQIQEEDSKDSEDDVAPQVDEDIEVKRMKRLELVRQQKPYLAISDDGSGWVSLADSARWKNDVDSEDQDLSPPRKKSPLKVVNETSDFSPSRRRRRADTSSPEPEDQDLSPPCRKSPLKVVNETSDFSPPRRRRRADTPSPEPVDRRQVSRTSAQKAASFVEARSISPYSSPRRSRQRQSSTPSRRRASKEIDPSLSPSRCQDPHFESVNESPDLSPPRRKRADTLSPESESRQQKSGNGDGERDLSPPRRSRHRVASPERLINISSSKNSMETGSPYPTPEDISPPRRAKKVNSGKEAKRAGLLTGKEMKEENERTRKEDALRHAKMISGRDAEAVFRDRYGNKISKEEYYNLQKVEEKPKEELEWGKGLAQKREAEARRRELELEKEKPFARTRDDPELDKILKERIRFGDPMAHLVKRKNKDTVLEDFGVDERMKESGFLIPQTIPNHSWIKRGIDYAENRYGIKPGRHWDGVDRSNGYEKELFKKQNEKRATEKEAYLWSVSEM